MRHAVAEGVEAMPEALQQMRQALLAAGDAGNAAKLGQLAEKWAAGRVNLAFCGHFSAGKSTLINKLCGHPLLPSSPIPTSANIVTIRDGEPGAHVTHKPGPEALEGAPGERRSVPLDELEAYCINGSDIAAVDIAYPIPWLGGQAALLDTPGIDSTDDAHQQSTESALHLADVVLYVMDYNHVQSENNLIFTKKMKEWGKPLYLVINMIDKHKERELPFAAYRAGTQEAFKNWGIEPDGLLFVTMKEPAHPHNEWGKLRALLDALIGRGEALRAASIDASARFLAAEHGKWLAGRNEPRRAELLAAVEADGELEAAQAAYGVKQAELAALGARADELQAAWRKELGVIIENANITPALTRDRAHAYLESRKPGFKVGFFARAAQTAAETEKRLAAFQANLAEQVEAQLDWHLRDALKKAAAAEGLYSGELAASIDALGVPVTAAWLAEQVHPGAVFGGEYTLNYTKAVAGELKLQYRKLAFAAVDRLVAAVRERSAQAAGAAAAELAALERQLGAWRELQQLAAGEAAAEAELLRLASWPAPGAPALPDVQQLVATEEGADAAPLGGALHVTSVGAVLQAAALVPTAASGGAAPEDGAAAAPGALATRERAGRVERKAAALEAAAALIEDIASMRSLARSMREKAARLRGRTFTVALFGAFSAGKSSFANALIGQRILPVSPNPTTAAINRIVPPQDGWPHGSAKVKMKSARAIEQDVLDSLELLGVPASGMDEALGRIAGLSPAHVTPKGKPHYSFLKAVERGWAEASPQLGSELAVTEEQFPAYVADEAKSCFVEYIERFDQNALTAQGIVFVDTPGADSINARHTGVAFNYIKNADAILFVTYYNHAFSQADREFLLQLGRVKDSFELDKMFFIVNAADLASSPEELEGVVKHVETNLLHNGIRHPRIYPLSSYWAAEGKITGSPQLVHESGIRAFEDDFVRFTLGELSEVAVHAADLELTRAAQTLRQRIEGARTGEAERVAHIERLRNAERLGLQLLEEAGASEEQKELRKEIQELLYYVKQRSMYRFGELFNYAFHPSAFREESTEAKRALGFGWNELQRMIAFDLSQEVLATTLRVENKLNALGASRVQRWAEALAALVDGFEGEAFEPGVYETPAADDKLQVPGVTEKLLLGYFKNARQFFEGDGKAKLRADLENRLVAPTAELMERYVAKLESAYAGQLESWLAELKQRVAEQFRDHIGGMLEALEMKVDVNVLLAKQERLTELRGAK